jgi:acetyl-CoA carboxylase biotin carboxyl carrier protein
MDMKEIKAIIELMDQNRLVEFEYEEGGKRIKLRRGDGVVHAVPMGVPLAPSVAGAPASPAPAAPARPSNASDFRSPLVGTFYRSPKPGSPPFVEVGDEVAAEQVLCIVEAMKVMNELKAPFDGIIREILPKDGQAVEYNDVLFVIEKK